MSRIEEFQNFREAMNKELLQKANLDLKRFFALDTSVYKEDVLPAKTKELLGLTASLVLRCDDCISYHLIQAKKNNICNAELMETFSIALVVGGSIVIPHLRRALDFWEELNNSE